MITQKKPRILRKTHNYIYVFMPRNSIASMDKNPFKPLPEDRFYDDLTEDTINQVYERIQQNSENGEKSLVFIDDMTASLKRSKFIQDTLKKMIYNRRHLKLNIILTAQSYVNIPLDCRKTIENLILFKPSKKEFELVFEELFETKKDLALKIMKVAYDRPHNFVFLNIPTQRIFRNFDELKIHEEDDEDTEDIEIKKEDDEK
jgi:hypothetical protein